MVNIKALPHKLPVREILISLIISIAIITASACLGYHAESITADVEITTTHIEAHDIFLNNVSMLGLNVLGSLLLGIPNLISGIMNGYSIGSFIALGGNNMGIEWVVRSLLPHAWLEVPVIVLAISFGVLPWILLISGLRKNKDEKKSQFIALSRYLLIAAGISALLLIPAAIIESNISMMI